MSGHKNRKWLVSQYKSNWSERRLENNRLQKHVHTDKYLKINIIIVVNVWTKYQSFEFLDNAKVGEQAENPTLRYPKEQMWVHERSTNNKLKKKCHNN
ncbi:hypothetical protein TKK_0016762 [Trichogramma kaykai]